MRSGWGRGGRSMWMGVRIWTGLQVMLWWSSILHWFRLKTQMEWFLQAFHIWKVVGSILVPLILYPKSCWLRCTKLTNLLGGSHLTYKWYYPALVEAPNSYGMVSTPIPNVCKVFGSIHMLWNSSWMHLLANTHYLVDSDMWNYQFFSSHLSYKWYLSLQTHMERFPQPSNNPQSC